MGKKKDRGSIPSNTAPKKDLIEQDADQERFFYDADQDEVYVLNETARLVCDLHRQGKTVEEIAQALLANYQTLPETDVSEDVTACIEILQRKGIAREESE